MNTIYSIFGMRRHSAASKVGSGFQMTLSESGSYTASGTSVHGVPSLVVITTVKSKLFSVAAAS